MPGDFLTDDISTMLQTSDFATAATYNSGTINIIFDEEFFGHDAGGTITVDGKEPIAYCRTSDVSNAIQGSTITISSVGYTVTSVEPDQTGMTILRLRTT